MTLFPGFFDQENPNWINYDDTDGPGGPPYGGNILRGTWTLTPEPPTWITVGGALMLFLLKLKQ